LTLADRAAPPAGSDEISPVDFEIGRPSAMRRRLASEIGAAIAHELNGPMTALLLYVGDIQHSIDLLDDRSLKQVADHAVLDAERIFGLIHKLGDLFEAPIRNDNAISVAWNAIDWWARNGQSDGANSGHLAFNEPGSRGERLTPREREVLQLVVQGYSNKKGAGLMRISYRAFECHRAEVIRKLGAKDTAELVRLALLGTAAPCQSPEQTIT